MAGQSNPCPVPETEILTKPKMVKVEGEVYCHEHGTIHDDTVNPYDEDRASWCHRSEHRKVYYRARKGDYKE